jgi:CubicO group peptidase (beta-lactamase class C family)
MRIVLRRSIRTFIMIGLVFPMMATCRAAKKGPWIEQVDAIFAGLTSPGEPGAAVLVRKDGRTVFERGYGVTDFRTERPIDGRTNFRLASVTKQFTAAALMLLVRDGKLRYEDRLTDIFRDFPAYGRAVTIRHLLNHTSGLPDYEDLMPPPDPSQPVEENQIADAGVLDLLEKKAAGGFPAGTRWAYSNSGYVVLGLIVAKVSGRPFPEFLSDRIFLPLGMTDTLAYVRGRGEVRRRAYGHTKDAGGWRETDQSPTSATLGDGGVYSSLEDLAKWDDALRLQTLLSESEMRPALEPVSVPEGSPVGPDGAPAVYGFGWFLDPWKGRPRMWHYGETVGFRTAIQRFTRDGLTVVVLANRADFDAAGLALRAAETYWGSGRN